jgi:hypothetical protein
MRQLIIASVTLIVLTAATSILAVQGQSQPLGHCGPAASSSCYGPRVGGPAVSL